MASSAQKRRAKLNGGDSQARWQAALREQCAGQVQQRKQQLLWTLRHTKPGHDGIQVLVPFECFFCACVVASSLQASPCLVGWTPAQLRALPCLCLSCR